MVEGDLWVHAQTDLADFYAGRLTLRQIWVRMGAMPPETFCGAVVRTLAERAEAASKFSDVDAALNMFGGQHA